MRRFSDPPHTQDFNYITGMNVYSPPTCVALTTLHRSTVIDILRNKVGAEVIVTGVPSVGSVESRAQKLHEQLRGTAGGESINFIAHSMVRSIPDIFLCYSLNLIPQGGLDCRHLITHIQPKDPFYKPVSLTTVCTPHRGSPFMDWCRVSSTGLLVYVHPSEIDRSNCMQANIGIGALRDALDTGSSPSRSSSHPPLPYTLRSPILARPSPSSHSSAPDSQSDANSALVASLAVRLASLPASLTTLILSMVDTPAYADLTTEFCERVFNPQTPMREGVRYFSVAARKEKMRCV